MTSKEKSKTTRMSIDVSLTDHKWIKVLAAAVGMSIKDFVVECIHEKIAPEKKPNEKTKKAISDAKKGKTYKAKDISDLYKQLNI